MASNYPPPGPGQPPYGQPSGQPNGQPGNYGNPYGQPNSQPPQYGAPYGQPGGQPGQNFNQPPAAPGYGTPPPGGYYGPPPGAAPYQGPQGTMPPYPQQPNYRPEPAVKPKAKSSRAGFITLGVIGVIVVIAVVLGLLGVFNNVDAADYPNATKASLTDKGKAYVNDLYDNKKSDNDNRKVFLTSDTPTAIFKYYQDDLTKKGWTFDDAGTLEQVPANKFSKGSKLLYVIVGDNSQGLVQDAASKNFILLITGDKV